MVGSAEAILFDLDGVLLSTSDLHRQAWAQLFGDWFTAAGITPAYTEADYFRYLDGRPRFDGVHAVLSSRGVELPWGTPADPPGVETVCGLGNRKNLAFEAALAQHPPAPFPEVVGVLLRLLRQRRRLAVVSSSRNALTVLRGAGILDAFELVADGNLAEERGLPGKPAPDIFRYAAAELGVSPGRAIVVEDATSGVAAGRSGGFGLVVGVDRGAGADDLRAAGADVVITSLTELVAGAGE